MRYALVLLFLSSATAASAGPFDFLGGIPDAPGVVRGGSFGLTGNDYWDQRGGTLVQPGRAKQHAKVRLRPPASDRRAPRS